MSAVHPSSPYFQYIHPLDFARLQESDLTEVLAIETDVYPFPWTRGNFLDSLYSGYESWIMRDASGLVAGYFLLLIAVDEAHLLNITVRRNLQGRGLGIALLNRVIRVAREKKMNSILLEVRPSNQRAFDIYRRYGFIQIGKRKCYYPAADGAREDAIVMRLAL